MKMLELPTEDEQGAQREGVTNEAIDPTRSSSGVLQNWFVKDEEIRKKMSKLSLAFDWKEDENGINQTEDVAITNTSMTDNAPTQPFHDGNHIEYETDKQTMYKLRNVNVGLRYIHDWHRTLKNRTKTVEKGIHDDGNAQGKTITKMTSINQNETVPRKQQITRNGNAARNKLEPTQLRQHDSKQKHVQSQKLKRDPADQNGKISTENSASKRAKMSKTVQHNLEHQRQRMLRNELEAQRKLQEDWQKIKKKHEQVVQLCHDVEQVIQLCHDADTVKQKPSTKTTNAKCGDRPEMVTLVREKEAIQSYDGHHSVIEQDVTNGTVSEEVDEQSNESIMWMSPLSPIDKNTGPLICDNPETHWTKWAENDMVFEDEIRRNGTKHYAAVYPYVYDRIDEPRDIPIDQTEQMTERDTVSVQVSDEVFNEIYDELKIKQTKLEYDRKHLSRRKRENARLRAHFQRLQVEEVENQIKAMNIDNLLLRNKVGEISQHHKEQHHKKPRKEKQHQGACSYWLHK